jgi:Skp family chaperone for outer membrane proteins
MMLERWRRLLAAMSVLAALLALPGPASAQDLITRMGVVDLDRVVRAFFLESEAYRTYQARRAEVVAEREEIEEDIHVLEIELLGARREGNRSLALRLEEQVFDMKEYLSQYVRVMNDILQRTYDDLKTSDLFIGELAEALPYVAEAGGYASITKTDGLLYWDPDIDLTDEVIAELARRAARR